jgi:hypothetical protein
MGRRRTLDADEAGEMIGVSAATAIYLHPDGRRLAEAMSGRGKAVGWKPDGNEAREGR